MIISDNVTIVIKTFQRKKSLMNLLDSILKYYPELKIIVIDDSLFDYKRQITLKYNSLDLIYIRSKFDIGISHGRRLLIESVTTKYFLQCDDDFEFYEDSNIELALEYLENNKLDVVGGDIFEYHKLNTLISFILGLTKKNRFREMFIKQKFHLNRSIGRYQIKNNRLHNKYLEKFNNELQVRTNNLHFVNMFFIAKTSIIKFNPYLDSLKFRGEDYFWTKLFMNNCKIGFNSEFSIYSMRNVPLFYYLFRFRPKNNYQQISINSRLKLLEELEIFELA
jgi:glycosyltransferase involved in cell wall biosynthesis